jgi:hypothetical protein
VPPCAVVADVVAASLARRAAGGHLAQSLRFTQAHRNVATALFAIGGIAALVCSALSLRSGALNQPAFGLALLAFGTGVAIFSWRLAVYLLLVYLPFSGIAILASYPHTQLADVAKDLAFVIPAYIGFLVTESRNRWVFPGLPVVPIVALIAVVAVECLNPGVPNLLVALIGVKVWLLYLPFLVLGYRLVHSVTDLNRLFAILLATAAVPILIGVVEAVYADGLGRAAQVFSLYGPAARDATQQFAQFHYGGGVIWRIPSTFSFVTQYFSFTVCMVVVAYGWWRLTARRWIGLLVLAATVLGSFTSGERSAIVMVPLLLLMVVVIEGRARLALGVVAVVVVMLIAAIALIGSGAGLIGIVLAVGIGEFNDIVVLGVVQTLQLGLLGHGTGTATGAARYAFPQGYKLPFFLESWWLRTIYELGLPGVAAATALFAILCARGWHILRSSPDRELRAVGAAILAFIVWNLIYNLKGSLMNLDPINVYLWLFAGLLLRFGTNFVCPAPMPEASDFRHRGSSLTSGSDSRWIDGAATSIQADR